jgi:hypothetical protein
MPKNVTIANAVKRMADFLNQTGGEITSAPIDYLNRAQQQLAASRTWDILVGRFTLTLDTNNAASLPADCDSILLVGSDSDSDGRLDQYYYQDGKGQNGYKLTNAFTLAAGHAVTITFFATPANAITLVYKKTLSDFTYSETGNYSAQYSFFPEESLVLRAQKIHLEESGLDGNLLLSIKEAEDDNFRNFVMQNVSNNADMVPSVNDSDGEEIALSRYTLNQGS